VLVAAADVGGECLDDDAVVCLAAAGFNQLSVGNGRNLHLAWPDIHNSTVAP
jgi:hypothetical protein